MTRREDHWTARSRHPDPPVDANRLQHRVDVAARPRNGAHVRKPADERLDVGAKGGARRIAGAAAITTRRLWVLH